MLTNMPQSHNGSAKPSLHIFVVAAEASGDRLGATLMTAVQERSGAPVRFSGVGGPHMVAAGLPSLFLIDDLSIIGAVDIVRRLPTIVRLIRATAEAAIAA